MEGITLNNRFEWKKTLGDPAARPGEYSTWGYRCSYGFGYYEMLQFCEDIGAKAMYVCNVGLSCQFRMGEASEKSDISYYIDDCLDAIEYALGDTLTEWGARRAADGHPAPFPLQYIEIGNENWGDEYDRRFDMFYQAIKQKYPQLTLIYNEMPERNGPMGITKTDMVDPLADYDLPTHNSNTCMPVLYGTRVYPDGVHDFKYEGDGTMVINLAWSHAVDDMGLWDNYGNLNRDLLWILRMPREEATKYISEAEYDSLPWEWEKAGDPRWEVELIRRMAYGEGDLSVIAKGTLAMMEKFGLPKSWLDRDDGATNSNLIYNGFPNHHGPAEAWQVGMLYNLVYNRDCMIHEIVCETGSGAPYEVTKKVMEDFFGEGCYDKAKAYTPINENKAKLAAYCVNDKNFHDSATLCNWMWPMTQSPSKERDYHGDLDLQADFMTAVTGETYTQAGLQEDGARITQMLRAMTAISFQQNCGSANLRQEHDAICDWVFDKDPDFKAFEEGTTKLDRADMEKAKDLFYDIFGWDRTTGVPTRETLEKYDLADMADDLEKRGIYAQNTAAAE